jgi:hypothetical protein
MLALYIGDSVDEQRAKEVRSLPFVQSHEITETNAIVIPEHA